jgi:hypothetical protein
MIAELALTKNSFYNIFPVSSVIVVHTFYMTRLYLIAAVLLFSMLACKKSKQPGTPATTAFKDTSGSFVQVDSFPLTIGNMWVYDNGDTIRAVADTMIGGARAVKLVKSNAGFTVAVYCANRTGGCYIVASKVRNAFIGFTVCPFSTSSDSVLVVPDTATLLAKLPVDTSASWEAHVPEYPTFTRRWTSYVTVHNAAGTFDCIKNTGDFTYADYFSRKGIVRYYIQPICFMGPCPPFVTNLVYVNF